MARAAIYTRISKDRTGQAAGVGRQLADCEKLCADRGWEIVERLEDNDRSAFSGRERPGYEQLLDLVADSKVDVVVAWHSDRLWRSVLEQQVFLAAGRQAGLQLVATPSGEFDPADGDDEFMSTLIAAVARKESADKSRRLRRKHAEIAERGGFSGGPRVFGYTADRGGIVQEEADELRRAVDRLLAGEPAGAIVEDWNGRGVTTPGGFRWTETTLGKTVTAARYAGLRTRRDLEPVTAEWEPIIDLVTHEQIVQIYQARRSGPRRRPFRQGLLTGILRCGRCGMPMNVGHNCASSGRRVYICPPPERQGCSGIVVTADLADAAARDIIAVGLDSEEFAQRVDRAADHAINRDTHHAHLAKQLGADRARLAELVEMWADGDLERSEWQRARERLVDRIEAAERDLQAGDELGQLLGAPTGRELTEQWETMSGHHRRAMVELLLDHIVVKPTTSRKGVPRNSLDVSRLQLVWRT